MPLVVFPDVSVGREELPALGALAWRGSMWLDHQQWNRLSQGINIGFYSCKPTMGFFTGAAFGLDPFDTHVLAQHVEFSSWYLFVME